MTKDYPLSSAQKRLWFQCQFDGAAAAYNMPAAFLLEGKLDYSALTAAFNALIQRHESLRTVFTMINHEPRQLIFSSVDFHLELVDLTAEPEPLTAALQLAQTNALTPFDLTSSELLLRASLLHKQRGSSCNPEILDQYVLVFNMHHLISDAWSINIMIQELSKNYQDFLYNQPSSFKPLRIQYKDYAAWHQQQLAGNALDDCRQYWLKQLSGTLPVLDLPADYPRPPVQTFNGDVFHHYFSSSQTQQLTSLARQQGQTLFSVLLSLTYFILSRCTGSSDIIIGTPVIGRYNVELEDQLGCYVNILALRQQVDHSSTFMAFIHQVGATLSQALNHQAYPLDQLIEELNLPRDISRPPLFNVMAVFHHQPPALTLENLKVTPLDIPFPFSKFDLTWHFSLTDNNRLRLSLEYRTDLFTNQRIQALCALVQALTTEILSDPAIPLAKIVMLPPAEQNRILYVLNDTAASYPDQQTLVDLFNAAVQRYPRHIAVVHQNNTLSYAELHTQTFRLAAYLHKSFSMLPGQHIAVVLNRHTNIITAILGILTAGCVYIPCDPDYPLERLQYIIQDSNARIIITETSLMERFADYAIPVICIDELPETEVSFVPPNITPDHTAYIIYTSGSTGKPKGCEITHRNVVRLMFNDRFNFEFDAHDVWITTHSFCFDFSVWEMYGALLYGAKLVIAENWQIKDPEALLDCIQTHRVTVLNQTPAAFYQLIDAEINRETHILDHHLRYVIFGGDKLNPAYLLPWIKLYPLERLKLINMYGITETTVHVSFGLLSEADVLEGHGRSPIGVPLPETRVYVCDPYMNLQPIGVTGELYVAGSGVGRGYFNREQLTRERFLPDPFYPGEHIYRTGDLGRWRWDGTLEYFGRNDHQIQIRGFRVEPGEIEAQLIAFAGVEKAVVTAVSGQTLELAAYIVMSDIPSDFHINDLRRHLQQTLPDYMIPNHIILLDRLPLTANNKIDRSALPLPAPVRPYLESAFIPPSSRTEQQIAEIWRETLNLNQIGLDDNFFDLGGHSLTLIQVRGKLNTVFNRNLTMVEMFTYPTVKTLADYLTRSPQTSDTDLQPVSKRTGMKTALEQQQQKRRLARRGISS